MRAASACVIEAIARIFQFREMANFEKARAIFMLAEGVEETRSEEEFERSNAFPLATGLNEPLLGMPALAERWSAV
jgi:hypothetical protein